MIYLRLIWSYLKIGLFGFGGGYAMLSLIEREIVGPGWITEKMFTDIVAISQMTPGPIGINSATYIGYVAPIHAGFDNPLWGILGSLLCTFVVVLPSFLLVAYTSHFISRHKESRARHCAVHQNPPYNRNTRCRACRIYNILLSYADISADY